MRELWWVTVWIVIIFSHCYTIFIAIPNTDEILLKFIYLFLGILFIPLIICRILAIIMLDD